MRLSQGALEVIGLLEGAGYEAYAVGGCVRDWLLFRDNNDIDLATSALCSEMHPLFEAAGLPVYDTGIKHGTITVVACDEPIEVTTYRVDGPYIDYRHPSEVTFTRNLTDDLARRDFTMNAIAYSPTRGFADPFGGLEDIGRRVIRCVGDPDARLSEDALRIMRALRFSAQLAFAIDERTETALRTNAHLLTNVAAERISHELCKLLCGPDVRRVLCGYVGILGIILPEVAALEGFDQHNTYHIYTTLEHTAVAVDLIAPIPVLRMTALLHDTGKPETFVLNDGFGRCPGHPAASARIARDVMRRLRFSRDFSHRVVTLVEHHEDNLQATRANVLHHLNALGPEMLRDLLALKRADVGALSSAAHEWLPLFDDVEYLMDELLAQNACYRLDQLAVSGSDIIGEGVEPGPRIGGILDDCLGRVMSGELPNDRDALLAHIRGLAA